jgi:beta-1,4-mannosyl-glycoprotein beta-1,4-N-acetylglucosaminyltransferase
MGNPKEMYFAKHKSRFAEFKDKIIYNPVNMDGIEFEDQWHREVYQKNHCIDGLKDAMDDDIIIFSDLDEIPNPDIVRKVLSDFDDSKIYHFAQNMYYFFFNYKNVDGNLLSSAGEFPGIEDKKWLGTRVCTLKKVKQYGFDMLRDKKMLDENAVRVGDGGWHFTYMGGTNANVQERIRKKLSAFSHEEFNNWRFYNGFHIWWSIIRGRDFLGRDARFKKVKIDSSYPKWLMDNYKKYPHLM